MDNFRINIDLERAPIFDELPCVEPSWAREPGPTSCSAIEPKLIAIHAQHGLMATADSSCTVRIFKQIDAEKLGISCRPDCEGRQRGWILIDVRDLPTRTGIRSKVISMEFTPEGDRLLVTTTGRNALTTFELDPATGRVLRQNSSPPSMFKV